jgi:uncharacterized transporter YbjL
MTDKIHITRIYGRIGKGDTVLQAGDVVEVLGAADELSEAELCLSR